MNKHLKLVREYNDTFSIPQAEHGASQQLHDLDIVMNQALLMDGGSAVFKAIKAGDMVQILAGLSELAYYALSAAAMRGEDVTECPITWRYDGLILSVLRELSEKINDCTSGNTEDYSHVYCFCCYLATTFINADFDKALQLIHDAKMAKQAKMPDLSVCVFE